jgi:signal transduction histidine kinase
VDAVADDPEHADSYRRSRAHSVIAAPISTEDRRIGVLTVYADRAPLFVEDDLWLLELLADQSAILLEARTLAVHASELRAREDAAQLKEEFLSAAAHDLRTPLTVVLGQAELLERRVDRDPSTAVDPAGIRRIAKEARRLRDLVSDLLDAQRLQQARAVMELRPADLRAVVEEVRQRYEEHETELSVRVPDRPVVVEIDRPRLEQVIENLVDNALKYGAAGDAPRLVLDDGAGVATLSVIDRGIGIPEPERGRVFERFFRASNAHSVTDTGIGLGLYICRRIVEEHGGRIQFAPTPGGGSTLSVTLPLLRDAAREPRVPAPSAAMAVQTGEVAADA